MPADVGVVCVFDGVDVALGWCFEEGDERSPEGGEVETAHVTGCRAVGRWYKTSSINSRPILYDERDDGEVVGDCEQIIDHGIRTGSPLIFGIPSLSTDIQSTDMFS